MLAMVAGVTVAACGSESPQAEAAAIEARPQGTVDSIFPVEEEMRRFRAVAWRPGSAVQLPAMWPGSADRPGTDPQTY
jgi:hypothetical protein